MIKETAYIFVDEFGTNVYKSDTISTTSHFVYTSIIVPFSKLNVARELREKLSKTYKQGSPLESKTFDRKDKNLTKRINLLKDLVAGLDFTIDVLVIDKRSITSDHLKDKKIFYKYFQKLFTHKYKEKYESFHIIADKIGSTEFCRELTQFINSGIGRDLFNPDRYFSLSEDKTEEPLIQFADIICGSLGKFYSSSHYHNNSKEIFDILHTRISCEYIPDFESKSIKSIEPNDTINRKIMESSLNSIQFDSSKIKDFELAGRVVDFLKSHYNSNPKRFIQTHEILDYLKNFSSEISIEKTRRIIRDLRYEGVFIISVSSQRGYKLAYDYNDVLQYFNHYSNYFIPMLKKIKIINQELASESFNEINLLEKDENFSVFRNLLSAANINS